MRCGEVVERWSFGPVRWEKRLDCWCWCESGGYGGEASLEQA